MARRPLRAGRRLADDDDVDTPVWRTPPALVAYALVGLLAAGVAFLQFTYEPPPPASAEVADNSATVTLAQEGATEQDEVPPVDDDQGVSPAPMDSPTPQHGEAGSENGEKADAGTPAVQEATSESDEREVAHAEDTGSYEQNGSAAQPPRTAIPSSALPALPRKLTLPAAPDPALQVTGRFGPLPSISEDGREPWKVYARPFLQERTRPRIAILLQDLGLSREQTNAAVQRLPGSITLGFTPYARDLDEWIAVSRAAGHEVMLQVPMEPFDFPTSDPGPHTLLTSAGIDQNKERLDFILSRVSGYVGVYNRMGDRFTSSIESMRPVLQYIDEKGLLFLDARTSGTSVVARIASDIHVPLALNNRELDQVASRVEIDAKLIDLENIARQEGSAIGIGRPYPVTIERLADWAATLEEKGFDLAPISAIAKRAP